MTLRESWQGRRRNGYPSFSRNHCLSERRVISTAEGGPFSIPWDRPRPQSLAPGWLGDRWGWDLERRRSPRPRAGWAPPRTRDGVTPASCRRDHEQGVVPSHGPGILVLQVEGPPRWSQAVDSSFLESQWPDIHRGMSQMC